MMMQRIEESRQDEGVEDEKPLGPRVSQVGETEKRLGEVIDAINQLGGLVIAASPKHKGSKVPRAKPYPQPVMRDGKTGEWIGKKSRGTLKRNHQERVRIAQAAAERWRAAQAQE